MRCSGSVTRGDFWKGLTDSRAPIRKRVELPEWDKPFEARTPRQAHPRPGSSQRCQRRSHTPEQRSAEAQTLRLLLSQRPLKLSGVYLQRSTEVDI